MLANRREKAKPYGGSIDTYKWKLAKDFGVSKISVNQYFTRLKKLNLIKRLDNGKLMIL